MQWYTSVIDTKIVARYLVWLKSERFYLYKNFSYEHFDLSPPELRFS